MFWTQEIWSQTQCRYSKGFITSFEEHDYLSPTFRSEFIYMGEKWQCIGEAYDCLAEEGISDSEKIRIMGNIIYHFFKQKPFLAERLIGTKGLWIGPQVKNHDLFWFKCCCPNCFTEMSFNYYGRLLMEVRDRLIWENKEKRYNSRKWVKRYF